jgi:ABC-type glycerol-3-phosphate transport system permease component
VRFFLWPPKISFATYTFNCGLTNHQYCRKQQSIKLSVCVCVCVCVSIAVTGFDLSNTSSSGQNTFVFKKIHSHLAVPTVEYVIVNWTQKRSVQP